MERRFIFSKNKTKKKPVFFLFLFVLFIFVDSCRGCSPFINWLARSGYFFKKFIHTERVYFLYEHHIKLQSYTSTLIKQLPLSLACSFSSSWIVSTTSDVHTFFGVGGVGGLGALYSIKYENKILYHTFCSTFTNCLTALHFDEVYACAIYLPVCFLIWIMHFVILLN